MTGPFGLVMGAEGTGIRRLTADHCDDLVTIPMGGGVDLSQCHCSHRCLSFEARRQRLSE